MRDGPACFRQWSDVPPSGHCPFIGAAYNHDSPPEPSIPAPPKGLGLNDSRGTDDP